MSECLERLEQCVRFAEPDEARRSAIAARGPAETRRVDEDGFVVHVAPRMVEVFSDDVVAACELVGAPPEQAERFEAIKLGSARARGLEVTLPLANVLWLLELARAKGVPLKVFSPADDEDTTNEET